MPLSLVPSLPLSLVLSLPLSCLSRCLSRTKGDDSKAEKGAFFEEKVNEVGVFSVSETQAEPRQTNRQELIPMRFFQL